ncbi:MAG: squalene synthase HpnC [Vicinamibacterales bacterium]
MNARGSMVEPAWAYAACQRLARAHYENFPVASFLLPAPMRPHVAAVYAFARVADDFADEGQVPHAVRLQRLERWGERLLGAAGRGEEGPPPGPGEPPETVAIFLALGATIRACGLSLEPFEALLSAFRQDVTVTRYGTWDALLDYCRRSANPVGRLVLRIARYDDRVLDRASDALCTALQLTNFWQDFAVDWQRGRVYVPQDVQRAHGAVEAQLRHGVTPEWSASLHEAATVTRGLFADGRPVCDGVRGRLRWELRATWLGGMRVLERLEQVQFDTFGHRPTLGALDASLVAARTIGWSLAS